MSAASYCMIVTAKWNDRQSDRPPTNSKRLSRSDARLRLMMVIPLVRVVVHSTTSVRVVRARDHNLLVVISTNRSGSSRQHKATFDGGRRLVCSPFRVHPANDSFYKRNKRQAVSAICPASGQARPRVSPTPITAAWHASARFSSSAWFSLLLELVNAPPFLSYTRWPVKIARLNSCKLVLLTSTDHVYFNP